MNFKIIPMLALAALPTLAQADERFQVGLGAQFQDSNQFTSVGPASANFRFNKASRVAPTLHFGYRVWDYGNLDLFATAEYQFATKYRVDGVQTVNGRTVDSGSADYRMEYIAPGLQCNYHVNRNFDWGVEAQLRFKYYKDMEYGTKDRSRNPWLGAHVRYTMDPVGQTRPFVAFRVSRAFAFTHNQPEYAGIVGNPANAAGAGMKRLDGIWDANLQFGVRF